MIIRLARRLYDLSFMRFLVVGVGSTIVNYGVFYVLLRLVGLAYVAASAIGFLAGVVVGYFFNKSWTFRSGERFVVPEVPAFQLLPVVSSKGLVGCNNSQPLAL